MIIAPSLKVPPTLNFVFISLAKINQLQVQKSKLFGLIFQPFTIDSVAVLQLISQILLEIKYLVGSFDISN